MIVACPEHEQKLKKLCDLLTPPVFHDSIGDPKNISFFVFNVKKENQGEAQKILVEVLDKKAYLRCFCYEDNLILLMNPYNDARKSAARILAKFFAANAASNN